ncbi:MAG: 2-oxo acid dehydrogenase subunit E2 [Planctomycetota bacterium]|nr:2-oxo acid dehydrogenase subunit E2 [Planctomycetota bacterium]
MKGYTRVKKLSTFRKIALSFWDKPTTGLIYGHYHADATKALQYLEKIEKETGVKASVGVLAGRAMALAFDETPAFNSKIIWRGIYQKDTVDVYYQVDIDDGGDLAGVVVRDTQTKTPAEIATELRSKAKKLRTGGDEQYEKSQKGLLGKMPPLLIRWLMRLLIFLQYNLGFDLSKFGAKPDPFGTLMVSNVGPFEIDVAYAPLATPTRIPCVFLVGGVTEKPMVVGNEIKICESVTMSATFDHRYGDGNQIGRINRRLRDYMHDPERTEKSLAEGKGLPRTLTRLQRKANAIAEAEGAIQASPTAANDEAQAKPAQAESPKEDQQAATDKASPDKAEAKDDKESESSGSAEKN